MADYLALVNKVINESGMEQNELTYDTWDAPEAGRRLYPRIKRAVREAWLTIQMERNEWEFGVDEITHTILPRMLIDNVSLSGSNGPQLGSRYRGLRSGLEISVINILNGPKDDSFYVEFSASMDRRRAFYGEVFEEIYPTNGGSSFQYKGNGAYRLADFDPLMREPHWTTFTTQLGAPTVATVAPSAAYDFLVAGNNMRTYGSLSDVKLLDQMGGIVPDFFLKEDGQPINPSTLSGAGVISAHATASGTFLLFGHFVKSGSLGLEWVASVLEVDAEGNIVGKDNVDSPSIYGRGGAYYNGSVYTLVDDQTVGRLKLIKLTNTYGQETALTLGTSSSEAYMDSNNITQTGRVNIRTYIINLNTMEVNDDTAISRQPTLGLDNRFAQISDSYLMLFDETIGDWIEEEDMQGVASTGGFTPIFAYKAPYVYFIHQDVVNYIWRIGRFNMETRELDAEYSTGSGGVSLLFGNNISVDDQDRVYATLVDGTAGRILADGTLDTSFSGAAAQGANIFALRVGQANNVVPSRSNITGPSGPSIMRYIPWENWVYKEISYTTTTRSAPQYVSQDPKGNLVFYPQTLSPFGVNFYYDTAPQELKEATDTPSTKLLPPEFHDWIAWRALENIARFDKNPDLLGYASTQARLYKRKAERTLMPLPTWRANRYYYS